jgi:hypothetical protein
MRSILIVALVVAVAWAFPKFRGSRPTQTTAARSTSIAQDRPPPAREESPQPLGVPALLSGDGGQFEVSISQPGDPTVPVAFDPCRPIHYVVNPRDAPMDGLSLVQSAVARVQAATGLRFIYDGATTEDASKNRAPYQPGRYTKTRWAPVLFTWTNETAFPSLAGYVAGVGASHAEYTSGGRLVYVTGQVVLDSQQLSAAQAPDRGQVRATVLHELGHLVGLDHTADRQQLMFSESEFNVRDYGSGDLRGLATLGTQACYPDI